MTIWVPAQESCFSVMSSKSCWVPVHWPNRLVLAETRVLSVGAGCGSAVKLVARTGRNSRSLSLDQSVRQPLPPPSPPSPPPFLFPPPSTISFSTTKQHSTKRLAVKEDKEIQSTTQGIDRSLVAGWDPGGRQVTSVICVSNRGSRGRGALNNSRGALNSRAGGNYLLT